MSYAADVALAISALRQLRLEAGLTQAQLARRLGKPQSFVSKYESGERRLDVAELMAVCRAMGIELVDFADQVAHLRRDER